MFNDQTITGCLLTYLLTLRCSLFSLFKLARTPPNLPAHISTPLHMLQTSFSPPSHTMLHLHSHHSILLSSPQSDPATSRPLIPLTHSTVPSKPKSKPKPQYLCQILPYRLYSTKTGLKCTSAASTLDLYSNGTAIGTNFVLQGLVSGPVLHVVLYKQGAVFPVAGMRDSQETSAAPNLDLY